MLRGQFRFETATHRYFVGDRPVPAITTVLRVGGHTKDGPWFKPEHRERGRLVHAACLVRDLGTPPSIPSKYSPYYDGWDAFMREVRPRWRELEQPRVNRRMAYAGTPDRVGFVNGYESIVEIKTGRAARWHAYQTAGQDLLVGGPMATRRRRLVVYLPGDGTYFMREHASANDYIEFLTALRETHGEAEHADDDDEWGD